MLEKLKKIIINNWLIIHIIFIVFIVGYTIAKKFLGFNISSQESILPNFHLFGFLLLLGGFLSVILFSINKYLSKKVIFIILIISYGFICIDLP